MINFISNIFKLGYNKIIGKTISILNQRRFSLNTEKILKNNFPSHKTFTFIQVGGNDGISFDFLYDFVTSRKSKGVIIEPIPVYYNELHNNYMKYPDILTVNKAVHPEKEKENIYKIKDKNLLDYPDWAKGIASFNKKHLSKIITDLSDEHIEELEVQCDTLMNIALPFLNNIDYLQIDTEGFDYEVLKQIDFNKYSPAIIKYERVNLLHNTVVEAEKLLRSNGYYCFAEGIDTIAVNLKKIKL